MAPSPTGLLHIGNVRTALFNWLFARHEGGEFLLRIENTDTTREVEAATAQIQESLRWLGLDWDGPVTFQLDNLETCQRLAHQLLDEGKAYEDDGAIRFRMPDEGSTTWDDVVLGRIEYPNKEIEDLVILRSDGRPTYNFASPVEDVQDRITHVLRGPDHVANTPKQINILRALGADLPVYGHVPNVNGADGKKLSKRHGAVTVDEFRSDGYLPAALVNYLALLGWSYDDKTTIMSRHELVERFTLDRIGASPATFDYQKLDWLNGVYLRSLQPEEYAHDLGKWLSEQGFAWPLERVNATVPLVQEKIERFSQYPDFVRFLFEPVAAARRRRPADLPGRRGPARRGRAVGGDRDRGGASGPRRRARPEAARRLRPDPARDHGLQGLARPVREHRAARSGGVPRPPHGGRARLSGRGRASGSSACWKARQACKR